MKNPIAVLLAGTGTMLGVLAGGLRQPLLQVPEGPPKVLSNYLYDTEFVQQYLQRHPRFRQDFERDLPVETRNFWEHQASPDAT